MEADKTPIVYYPDGAYGGGWAPDAGPTCVAGAYAGDPAVRSSLEYLCLGKGSCSLYVLPVDPGDKCPSCWKASCELAPAHAQHARRCASCLQAAHNLVAEVGTNAPGCWLKHALTYTISLPQVLEVSWTCKARVPTCSDRHMQSHLQSLRGYGWLASCLSYACVPCAQLRTFTNVRLYFLCRSRAQGQVPWCALTMPLRLALAPARPRPAIQGAEPACVL